MLLLRVFICIIAVGFSVGACEPERRELSPEIVAKAWPQDKQPGMAEAPKLQIGMMPLSRTRAWPLLRRWQRGGHVAKDPTICPDAGTRELEILGEQVMQAYCVGCHGRDGHGNGPMSRNLRPAPRDFTKGAYRFRTTPTGQAPTASDLFRVVTGGLRGTPMTPFADLPERERWAVSHYLMTLSPRFKDRPGRSVEQPTVPENLDDPRRVERGHEIYDKLGCAQCHGPQGAGDGPLAEGLRMNPRASPPANLKAGRYKRGGTAEDLYLTLVTGLNGTPMVSFRDRASDDELFDLIAFLRALPTVTEKY